MNSDKSVMRSQLKGFGMSDSSSSKENFRPFNMQSVEEDQSKVINQSTDLRWQRWGRRWSQAVTIAIAINLLLVLFNLTYVPLRHIYQVYLPGLVKLYDPLKGIEPHPVTQGYLQDLSTLSTTLESGDLNDSAVEPLLADLRQQSTTLIDENPYLASGQITTFARLKRRIQDFTDINSADRAFQQFWRADYLQDIGWPTAEQFIDTQLVPLLQRNYFRQTLPTGQFVDEFWRLDIFFVIFFAVELLIRTLIISRRDPDISWGVALARRWYELPLLLPFWRWFRLLPLAVRCHRTHLLNVENLIGQVTHEPAAYLADRVSKFAMVRLINQTQTTVRSGALLDSRQPDAAYTRIGDSAKLDQITDRLVQVIVLRVMPTVKPDLEQLLRHSLRQALLGGDVYTGLRQLPGFDSLPGDAVDGVADYLAQAGVDVLAHSYTDDEGRVLLDQLSREFRHALGQELQTHANSEELQALLSDLLEELKVNYIQRSEQDDPRTTLQEVDVLDQQTQSDQSPK